MPTDQEIKWAATWKAAGPVLQRIRDEELRQKNGKGVRSVEGYTVFESNPHRNGLVVMQAWFQRFQILMCQAKPLDESDAEGEGPG